MSDREVKRLTPNSIANLVMADEAWHDSLYVRAEDYDSLLADFEALRTALAAEQPKVSVTLNPDAMRTVSSGDAVLAASSVAVTVSSALAAEQPKPEPVAYFDLQKQVFYWARPTMIDVPMTIALEPLPLYAAPPEDEALRRDAERLTDEQIDIATAKERDALLDHIYEYGTAAEGILERIRKLARAAIDAAMGDKT